MRVRGHIAQNLPGKPSLSIYPRCVYTKNGSRGSLFEITITGTSRDYLDATRDSRESESSGVVSPHSGDMRIIKGEKKDFSIDTRTARHVTHRERIYSAV